MSTLDCMAASPQRVADPNAQQMADMIRAFWISQIVGTFAQLAIPDHLAGGALSSAIPRAAYGNFLQHRFFGTGSWAGCRDARSSSAWARRC